MVVALKLGDKKVRAVSLVLGNVIHEAFCEISCGQEHRRGQKGDGGELKYPAIGHIPYAGDSEEKRESAREKTDYHISALLICGGGGNIVHNCLPAVIKYTWKIHN